MSKIYKFHEQDYHGGDSRSSSMDEYLININTAQSVLDDFNHVPPQVHKFHNKKPEKHHEDHHEKIFFANHHHQAPDNHKKVHFTTHEKAVDIDSKAKGEVYKEKAIDFEADGFIQQKHKSFDSCSTFKGY